MNKSIFITDTLSGDLIVRIDTKDITFVTSNQNHTVVNTKNNQYVIAKGMDAVEIDTLLKSFVQVNPKMWVNVNHIDTIEHKECIFIGDNRIQIEKEFKNDFFLRITILE